MAGRCCLTILTIMLSLSAGCGRSQMMGITPTADEPVLVAGPTSPPTIAAPVATATPPPGVFAPPANAVPVSTTPPTMLPEALPPVPPAPAPTVTVWTFEAERSLASGKTSSAATADATFQIRAPLEGFDPTYRPGYLLYIRPDKDHCSAIGLRIGIVARVSGMYLAGQAGGFMGASIPLNCMATNLGGCYNGTFAVPLPPKSAIWMISAFSLQSIVGIREPLDLVIDWIYSTSGSCAKHDAKGFGIRHRYAVGVILMRAPQ